MSVRKPCCAMCGRDESQVRLVMPEYDYVIGRVIKESILVDKQFLKKITWCTGHAPRRYGVTWVPAGSVMRKFEALVVTLKVVDRRPKQHAPIEWIVFSSEKLSDSSNARRRRKADKAKRHRAHRARYLAKVGRATVRVESDSTARDQARRRRMTIDTVEAQVFSGR